MELKTEVSLSSADLAIIRAGMRRYNQSCVPLEEYTDLSIITRNDDGAIIGGAIGETGRGWLNISVVWVAEKFRRQRIGKHLVETMEAEAVKRGCRNAYLDTFSYQARPFYEKLGYEIFGTLDDYPLGHQRFFMRKQLTICS